MAECLGPLEDVKDRLASAQFSNQNNIEKILHGILWAWRAISLPRSLGLGCRERHLPLRLYSGKNYSCQN